MSERHKVVKGRLPCPKCPSSDGYHIYDDGSTFCFVCEHSIPSPVVKREFMEQMDDTQFTKQYVPLRGLTAATLEFYGAVSLVSAEDTPEWQVYTYPNGAEKWRNLVKKDFYVKGPMSDAALFGRDRFNAGSSKFVTITEGELDAMSVYQMVGNGSPVVSVRGSSSAKADCARERDWLNSFEGIYLCFDNDEPGRKAKAAVASLFDFNKVFDVPMSLHKDANEYLKNGQIREFRTAWYNSKRFLPQGVISRFSEFREALEEAKTETIGTYPFPTWQTMTYGIRPEITLLTAQEGIGKTEILRAIEYHLMKTTDHNLGIIHLEEGKARTIKGIAGYELKQPVHLPDVGASIDDIERAYTAAIGRNDRVHIFSAVGADDPDEILETIRFLVAACGCKVVFLDHITMLVTSSEGDDERKKLDYISTKLAMMVEELQFALFLISHVNDDGMTRGSRNISKVCHTRIDLTRDLMNEDVILKNTTITQISKNRFGSKTGKAGLLYFDPETYILTEKENELPF